MANEQVPESTMSAEGAPPAPAAASVEDVKMDTMSAETAPRVESEETDTANLPTVSLPAVDATEDVAMDAPESAQVADLPPSKVEDALKDQLPSYSEATPLDAKLCGSASLDKVASSGEADDVASTCGPEPHVNGSGASGDGPSSVPPTEDVTMEATLTGPPVSLDAAHLNGSLAPEISVPSRGATPLPPSSTISPDVEDVAMEVEDRDGAAIEAATHAVTGTENSAAPASNEEPRSSRPRGFDQYEQLSQLNKIEFCQNILLPEAIKQILLWRNEKRTSLALLSDEQEAELSVHRGEAAGGARLGSKPQERAGDDGQPKEHQHEGAEEGAGRRHAVEAEDRVCGEGHIRWRVYLSCQTLTLHCILTIINTYCARQR
ncbi:hypothetical protein BDZ89DRAFT_445336 [Hymenopellis radicata]|nr:hypothetical protein BDZ89DRAFT_445336 [Hymenopellis radicata]